MHIRAWQGGGNFRFRIFFYRQIFPRMNRQIVSSRQQSIAQVFGEDPFLGHLPEWVILISITKRFVEGIINGNLRM